MNNGQLFIEASDLRAEREPIPGLDPPEHPDDDEFEDDADADEEEDAE